MSSEARTIKTHDGLVLHLNEWTIPDAIADIAFAHGFCEHSGRYHAEAKFFNAAGYNFKAYDQRTHGRSEGKYRSYITDFNDYLKDYEKFLTEMQMGKDRPYYLAAHSMGGLVQCSYILNQRNYPPQCKGAIFSAPLLMPDRNTAPLLQKVSGIVGTLLPRLKAVGIDAEAISRDPAEVKKYLEDPHNYTDKFYAASGYALLNQMKSIRPKLKNLTLPFLVLHGTADTLAEIGGSELLHSESNSQDKTFVPLKDYKHEITRDIGKEKVLQTILNWMNERL